MSILYFPFDGTKQAVHLFGAVSQSELKRFSGLLKKGIGDVIRLELVQEELPVWQIIKADEGMQGKLDSKAVIYFPYALTSRGKAVDLSRTVEIPNEVAFSPSQELKYIQAVLGDKYNLARFERDNFSAKLEVVQNDCLREVYSLNLLLCV